MIQEVDKLMENLVESRERTRLLYEERCVDTEELVHKMNEAYNLKQLLGDNLSQAYDLSKEDKLQYLDAWEEYLSFKEEANKKMNSLRERAKKESRMERDCSSKAYAAYKKGDKARANKLSEESRRHADKSQNLYCEVTRLYSSIVAKRAEFDEKLAKEDREYLQQIGDEYRSAKELLYSTRADYKVAKKERDNLSRIWVFLNDEIQRWEALKDSLDNPQSDEKIVIHRYYGGVGELDGFGHGHQVFVNGKETYNREPFTNKQWDYVNSSS